MRFWRHVDCGSIVAQPLCQRFRQQLRLRMRDDLQTSRPDLVADRPWLLRMRGRGPDHMAQPAYHFGAEAFAGCDTARRQPWCLQGFVMQPLSSYKGRQHRMQINSRWHMGHRGCGEVGPAYSLDFHGHHAFFIALMAASISCSERTSSSIICRGS